MSDFDWDVKRSGSALRKAVWEKIVEILSERHEYDESGLAAMEHQEKVENAGSDLEAKMLTLAEREAEERDAEFDDLLEKNYIEEWDLPTPLKQTQVIVGEKQRNESSLTVFKEELEECFELDIESEDDLIGLSGKQLVSLILGLKRDQ